MEGSMLPPKAPRNRIDAINHSDDRAWELVFSRLAPEPLYLACAALACRRFAEVARVAWKQFCRWTAPDIVECYEEAGTVPPGGWRTLYRVLVWCPGANWPEIASSSERGTEEMDERSHVQRKVPNFSLERSRLCLQEALRQDKLWLSMPSCEHDINCDNDEPAPPAFYRGLFFDFSQSATWERCKEKPVGDSCPFCQQEMFELGYVHNQEQSRKGVENTTCLSSEAPKRLHCEGYQGSLYPEKGEHAWYGQFTYAVVCKVGHVTGRYFDGYVYCEEQSDCEVCEAGEMDELLAPWDARDKAFQSTYEKRCLEVGDLRTMFPDEDNLRKRMRESDDSTSSPEMMQFLEEMLQAGRKDDLTGTAMGDLEKEVEEAMERVYTDAAIAYVEHRDEFLEGYGKPKKDLKEVKEKAREAIQAARDYDAGKRVKRRINPYSQDGSESECDLEHWLHIHLHEDISRDELRALLLQEGKGITRIDLEQDEVSHLSAYVEYSNLAAAMVAWKNLTRRGFQLQGEPASVAFWPDQPAGPWEHQKLKYKLCAEEKDANCGRCWKECSPKCPHGRCEACCRVYTESAQLPPCEDHKPACDTCLANLEPAEADRCKLHLCAACCTADYCSLHHPPKVERTRVEAATPLRRKQKVEGAILSVGRTKVKGATLSAKGSDSQFQCTRQGCRHSASKKCENVCCKQHCTTPESCKYHQKKS